MKIILRVFLFAMFGIVSLTAKTVQVQGDNITLDLPDGWTIKTEPGVLFFASNGSSSVMQARKYPNTEHAGITPAFVDNMKSGMLDKAAAVGSRMVIKSEHALTISGAPACVFKSVMFVPNKAMILTSSYVIATRDSLYLVSAQTADWKKRPEVNAIATSFHFTVMPALPGENPDGRAYRIGYFTGVGIGVLAILLIVWLAIRGVWRRKNG